MMTEHRIKEHCKQWGYEHQNHITTNYKAFNDKDVLTVAVTMRTKMNKTTQIHKKHKDTHMR